ncbi:MAG: exonuclease domain-containing protein [bacterium]|nr:exonuclease domain-containing protein [bacterium]
MARRLDQILVIDIESTCWDGTPPPGQENEIIEIGLCTLEVAGADRRDRESLLVRPERSTVSAFCTELTTLTQDQVDRGIPFAEACGLLAERYRSKQRTWASYGDYDRRQFARQCESRQLPYPLGPTHLNVKNLLALALGLRREVGMAEALALLDLPLEGTHHRGDDDAWNIAGMLAVLLRRLRSR